MNKVLREKFKDVGYENEPEHAVRHEYGALHKSGGAIAHLSKNLEVPMPSIAGLFGKVRKGGQRIINSFYEITDALFSNE